jgi:hypothetical protein
MEYTENIGDETSWKTTTWKYKKAMDDSIKMDTGK